MKILIILLESRCIIKVEPYWNVNFLLPPIIRQNKNIKVEPYWNVNGETYFVDKFGKVN